MQDWLRLWPLNAVLCWTRVQPSVRDEHWKQFKFPSVLEVAGCRLAAYCHPLNFPSWSRFSRTTADKVAELQEVRVLIIEVTNARDVVRQRIGRLGERLIGKVVDPEAQVEKALIQEIDTAFREFGIEARILSVQGPQLVGRQHIELPIQVREEREVRLNDAGSD